MSEPAAVGEIKNSGFDVLIPYVASTSTIAAVSAAARADGLSVIAHPDEFLSRPIESFGHLDVDGWFIYDEPDVAGLSPGQLSVQSERIRKWDPTRYQTFAIGQGRAAEQFGTVGDAIMLDWYPVPHLPLGSVADQVETARAGLPPQKPIWFILQAFDWRDYSQHNSKKAKIGRFPTTEEMRTMAYLALEAGADGIFFFKFDRPGGVTLADTPELWTSLSDASRELADFLPVLRRANIVPLPFVPDRGGYRARAWRSGSREYVVLSNPDPKRAIEVPAELRTEQWRPLFATRSDYVLPGHSAVFEQRSFLGAAIAAIAKQR